MILTKYYDYRSARSIDILKDGCDLSDWKELYGKSLFARHPKGFFLFLPPHELQDCDEYKESDPYTVEKDIEGDFQNMRIDCTLQLVAESAKNKNNGTLRILDLGCGQGHITYRVKQAYPNAEISALDYSVSAISYASDHFQGIDFIVANAYDAPYSENYFDIIICNNLWEHVPDPLLLLKQIKKILKVSGFLIISTPSRYRLGNLLKVIRGMSVNFRSNRHVTEYSVGQVIEQLRYGGFTNIQILSKPEAIVGIKRKVAHLLLSSLLFLTGSHHRLESTVFYLSQKNN